MTNGVHGFDIVDKLMVPLGRSISGESINLAGWFLAFVPGLVPVTPWFLRPSDKLNWLDCLFSCACVTRIAPPPQRFFGFVTSACETQVQGFVLRRRHSSQEGLPS